MYAVISDRGRQYCVTQGEVLAIDLHSDGEGNKLEEGQTLELGRVLLIGGGDGGPVVGTPEVAGAKVIVEIVEHYRDKKIHVGWYRRRKNFRKHVGHRQKMTRVKVREITHS